MTTEADARAAFCGAAMTVHRMPYRWGGETLEEGGFDCSGLVCWDFDVLARLGWSMFADVGRRTAHGLRDHFQDRFVSASELKPGALTFFENSAGRVYHVKIFLAQLPSGYRVAIDAGGGGSKTDSFEAAIEQGAFVRLSNAVTHGRGRFSAVDPFAFL